MAQMQKLKGLGFVGHPCGGNGCFAAGSHHLIFVSSKSHWKIQTGQDIIMENDSEGL